MIDDDLTCIDISIYNALFLIWNSHGFETDLSIHRNDVMKLAKVGNATTYTSSLKKLHSKNYIEYKPSYNPLIGSKVTMYRFDKGGGKGTVISSGNAIDKGSGLGDDTFIKQYNNLTLEHINYLLAYANKLSKKDLDLFLKSFNDGVSKKFIFKTALLDYGFEENIVDDWLAVRKTKKATNTKTAFDDFICEIEKKSCNINEVLKICVIKSWSGFKHVWIENLNKVENGKSEQTNAEIYDNAYNSEIAKQFRFGGGNNQGN
jgi:hypothetical protein